MNYQEIERFCVDNQILLLVLLAGVVYAGFQNAEVRMFVEQNQKIIICGGLFLLLVVVMNREEMGGIVGVVGSGGMSGMTSITTEATELDEKATAVGSFL